MWLWDCELKSLGFKHKSERYWQCERRYGLPATAYLSIFIHAEHRRSDVALVDLCSFHVTFLFENQHVHFYYHERAEGDWEPGGHTSKRELLRLNLDPRALCQQADEIAARVVEQLGGELRARRH